MNVRSDKTLCMGCGVCASVCPKNAITMTYNAVKGTFEPVVDKDTCVDCSICAQVCTHISGRISEPKSVHRVWKGYADNRFFRSSGGLCTSIISALLEQKIVDSFIVAKYSDEKPLFYKIGFVAAGYDAEKTPRSVYAPLEFSEALLEVKNNPDRTYGIVALPCVISSVTNAQNKLKTLLNIKVKLALTCGSLPTYSLIEYVAAREGVNYSDIERVVFREKAEGRKSSNHGCSLKFTDRAVDSLIQGGTFGRAFLNKFFIHSACNYCDDVFGYNADASFMDAWGQDSEEKGMSLVSVQSSLIDEVMEKLSKKDSVHIESVDSASPVRAQASVGVYRRKAKGAFCRGILLRKMGFILPPREKSRLSLKDFVKLFVKAYIEMRLNARSAFLWKLYKTGKIDIGEYDKKMDFFVRLLKR